MGLPSFRSLRAGCALLIALTPGQLWACATCFGQSDSSLAAGLNWGIASLLLVVTLVLAGIAAFFIRMAKRSAAMEGPTAPAEADFAERSAPHEPALTTQ